MGTKFSKFCVMILVVVNLASSVIVIVSPHLVSADSTSDNWSWINAEPVVDSVIESSYVPVGLCEGNYQTLEVMSEPGFKRLCMAASSDVRFGTYYVGNGNAYSAAVGFKYDSKMYKVRGICPLYDSCLYLPSTDSLAVKEYLTDSPSRSLVVYRNFSGRLKPVADAHEFAQLEYIFDASSPDYVFKSITSLYGPNNYAWPIGGFGSSDNGDWLAVEFHGRGIGLLNVKTLEMKRVSMAIYYFGGGMDPTFDISVSDDGKNIAFAGYNTDLRIFNVNSDCGDVATEENMSAMSPVYRPCKEAKINTETFMNRFSYAAHPRFNSEGGELSFFAMSYLGNMKQISLRAAGYGGQRIDYLAMGDSFTSGEGETDDSYYITGTNDEYEKCHVSTRSYPFIIAQWSHIDPTYMRSVACSGAMTVDVVGNDSEYLGQGKRLGKDNMSLSLVDAALSKGIASTDFIQGRIHQDTFVSKYKPKVITIGIGGNDAGFMDILKSCIGLGTCDAAGTTEGKEKMATEIKDLFSTLVNTYQQIHISSPSSKIYAIGYPKIIVPDGNCSWLIGNLLDKTEREFMNEGIVYLNEVIAAAAKAAGIKYVDIQDSFGDFALCGSAQPSVVRSMNSIALGDDSNMLNNSQSFRFIGNESFHPNSLGHQLDASSILGSVGNIMDYEYCSNGVVVCPDQSVVAPEPSTYWLQNNYHNYPKQIVSNFVSILDNLGSNLIASVKLNARMLQPLSSAVIEIHSNRISLGHFITNSDGSLDVDVILPHDLEEGYHTVHLFGTSYSGEEVDLYQVIEVRKPYIPLDDQSGVNISLEKDVLISETLDSLYKMLGIVNSDQAVLSQHIQSHLNLDINKDFIQNDNENINNASNIINDSLQLYGNVSVKGDYIKANEPIALQPIVKSNIMSSGDNSGILSIVLALVVIALVLWVIVGVITRV